MPGFTTHYILGARVFNDFTDLPLKKIIDGHRSLFQLGLQGPDIFFYNLPFILYRDYRNVGSYMHEHHVRDFFRVMLKKIDGLDSQLQKEEGLSYFCGYLCHYVGDTICHPYVYGRICYNPKAPDIDMTSRHAALENDLDALLLWHYLKKKPSEFNQAATIRLNKQEKLFITHFLADCINEAYYPITESNNFQVTPGMVARSIFATRAGCRTLLDKKSHKQKSFSLLENLFKKEPVVSSRLVTNNVQDARFALNPDHEPWSNPWDGRLASTASFEDLWKQSIARCHLLLRMVNSLVEKSPEPTSKERKRFAEELGDNSLHSGLPVRDD